MINMLFALVRHGHTSGNDRQTYRSWSNGPDAQLTAEGRNDVREAGIYLQRTGQNFPLILSDNLDRSLESREILADILDLRGEQETDPRLRPLNVGDYTGQSKLDYPLDEFMSNPAKRIPGGESLNEFNARQSRVFADILELVQNIHKPVLIVCHGSNVCYLHNHGTKKQRAIEGPVGYEGLVNPGGVLMFNAEGIFPLTNKREGAPMPLKEGTPTSGFVKANTNRPPRECWHCKWSTNDINRFIGCLHPVVRVDPDLQSQKQTDGTILVEDRDCCDFYSPKIAT